MHKIRKDARLVRPFLHSNNKHISHLMVHGLDTFASEVLPVIATFCVILWGQCRNS